MPPSAASRNDVDGASLVGAERERYVEGLFDRIARPYDDLNRLISWGRDLAWRRGALAAAGAVRGCRVADLGCGTGDFCLAAAEIVGPEGEVVGVDLSEGMLAVARPKLASFDPGRVRVRRGAAQETGLADGWADVVTMGWVLRNVGDRPATYAEVRRVLKPGGRLSVLDCSRPGSWILRAGFSAYLHCVMPVVVRLRGGDREAYRYLARSTDRFLTAAELTKELQGAGFRDVASRGLMGGAVALHVATR